MHSDSPVEWSPHSTVHFTHGLIYETEIN